MSHIVMSTFMMLPTEIVEAIVDLYSLPAALCLANTSQQLHHIMAIQLEFTLLRGLLRQTGQLDLSTVCVAGAFLANIGAEELVNELLQNIINQRPP